MNIIILNVIILVILVISLVANLALVLENSINKKHAKYDELTSIFNRRQFDEDYHSLIHYQRRYEDVNNLLIIIDVDNFKQINDTQGHEFGDAVLKDYTRHLSNFLRKEDRIYRLGGDEFAIIAKFKAKAQINDFISRLKKQFPHLSIGSSIIQNEKAFTYADINMYQHKKSK